MARYVRKCVRACRWTRGTQAPFLTGYGEAFNPDVVSRMVSSWDQGGGARDQGLLPPAPAQLRSCSMLEGGGLISVTSSSSSGTKSWKRRPSTPRSLSASSSKSTPGATLWADDRRVDPTLRRCHDERQCGTGLKISDEALEALRALPKELRRRIGQKIDALQTDLQGDVRSLGGQERPLPATGRSTGCSSRSKKTP